MRALTVLIMTLLLAACQDKPAAEVNTNGKVITNQESESNKALANQLPCVSKNIVKKSPPIQDKSKIKAMLLKSGKITAEMTSQQADKIVDDFIRAKQNTKKNLNKNCE